jgi:hypothetical protein
VIVPVEEKDAKLSREHGTSYVEIENGLEFG